MPSSNFNSEKLFYHSAAGRSPGDERASLAAGRKKPIYMYQQSSSFDALMPLVLAERPARLLVIADSLKQEKECGPLPRLFHGRHHPHAPSLVDVDHVQHLCQQCVPPVQPAQRHWPPEAGDLARAAASRQPGVQLALCRGGGGSSSGRLGPLGACPSSMHKVRRKLARVLDGGTYARGPAPCGRGTRCP